MWIKRVIGIVFLAIVLLVVGWVFLHPPQADHDQKTLTTMAVNKEGDQAGFFATVMSSSRQAQRLEAVEKLTDQTCLSEVVKQATKFDDQAVREAALRKLTDQALLADLIINDDDGSLLAFGTRVLFDRLTDPVRLADVARNAKTNNMRSLAINELADQAVLTDLAENDENAGIRQTARSRLDTLKADERFLPYK